MKRRQEGEEEKGPKREEDEDPSLLIDRILRAQQPRTEPFTGHPSLAAALELDDVEMFKAQFEAFKKERLLPMPQWLKDLREAFYGPKSENLEYDLRPLLKFVQED